MSTQSWIWRMVCLGVALALVAPAVAQDPATDAQNKLLAQRAAQADCYRKLAETIKGMRITSDTLVRDFITESDVIQSELDTFIKGVRLGKPMYFEDGTCEVKAEVTVASVITHLKEIHTRHYQGDRIKGTDFEQISQHVKKDVIECTGWGAPRPELPPDLPEGVVDMLPPAPPDLPLSIPDIWKHVPGNQRLMAQRAAELDAKRKLLERIKGLRITSDTLVRDFITEYDEIQANADGIVIGAKIKGRPYLHTNELIVDVTVEVPVESVITTIKELHTRHYQGDRVTGTDIVNIKQRLKNATFEATGSGVPNVQYVEQTAASTGIVMPDWMAQTIKATGNGTDPAIETAQGRLKAARAAEMDAKRKLAEQIFGLQIDSNTYVRDFVTEYDEINSQVNAVLSGAVVENTQWGQDMATVTVSIPGADVWRVVHSQMVIVQRR